MEATIIPFPSHRVGLRKGELFGRVSQVEDGYALTIRTHLPQQAMMTVYAQHKRVPKLVIGDWVKFSVNKFGVVVEERLARPGGLPIPKVDYRNGGFVLNRDDPAFRLYNDRQYVLNYAGHTLIRHEDGSITVDGKLVRFSA